MHLLIRFSCESVNVILVNVAGTGAIMFPSPFPSSSAAGVFAMSSILWCPEEADCSVDPEATPAPMTDKIPPIPTPL
jgi:hypothetical protein